MDLNKKSVIGRKAGVTTAVFNASKDAIVAGLDKNENGLVVLQIDESLAELNTINLTFPGLHEAVGVDKYRLFWITKPHRDHYIMFAAYYDCEGDMGEGGDDRVGKTLMIWIG